MYSEKDFILFNWRLFFLASTNKFLIAYSIHIIIVKTGPYIVKNRTVGKRLDFFVQ